MCDLDAYVSSCESFRRVEDLESCKFLFPYLSTLFFDFQTGGELLKGFGRVLKVWEPGRGSLFGFGSHDQVGC